MNDQFKKLADRRGTLQFQFQQADALLKQERAACSHIWGETKYTPDITPGYHFAGDPEGTMGVDRQLPMDMPRQETPKWTRTCTICGLIETTTRTTVEKRERPRF